MHYTVEPGLYALGQPDSLSPVLATANYKMSFDRLRNSLPGRNAWILVLDTKGINVWCAAGKGTFGTRELASRIRESGPAAVTPLRKIILPQLSAPGVSAHEVHRLTGFRVVYGPVRATDLPRFLDSGLKATPDMRRKDFPLTERLALIPIELLAALKIMLFLIPAVFFVSGFLGHLDYWSNAGSGGKPAAIALLSAVLAGAVLTPVLLPWLPGRAFSLKGAAIGLLAAIAILPFHTFDLPPRASIFELVACLLIVPALSAYLAMNFTGASTYTSLSGVRKEMRWAVPIQIAGALLGVCLWVVSRLAV